MEGKAFFERAEFPSHVGKFLSLRGNHYFHEPRRRRATWNYTKWGSNGNKAF